MTEIKILNIPNYYSSYYLLGLSSVTKLTYQPDPRFLKYNNKPQLIFELHNKLAVIDNDDPTHIIQELYDQVTLYFVTNKLKTVACYEQEKVKPLFPHYPVNISGLYIKIFGIHLFRFLKLKELASQLYIYKRRPIYKKEQKKDINNNYVFFSSNIWKKEPETNTIRAAFIRYCREDRRIQFEGGFIGRSDGNNFNFGNEINTVKYNPKVFSKLSSKSLVVLNNSAVCGAVSWRLAEYLNKGLFVLSFPFKIVLAIDFDNGENIHFIDKIEEFKSVFDIVFSSPNYHKKISENGKKYFETYCTPEAQANYIIQNITLK
ncbi:hypothetical protein [Flavobacterium sp. UMI-01]|uniref:hypothetical protein n=1 Tax=Flavobacterium sp. UMI-01 TaxID=1441053 RepID=UPI001C7D8632|nr:hypothetical protein [Flavobacterium sp. UMI-01]GIZ07485.1 hypothetical protein FUMI01_02120 [Flavobacterium sp. UMI-01]